MRFSAILCATALLAAGCSQSEEPASPEIASELEPFKVLLLSDGLKANAQGAQKLVFGATKDATLAGLNAEIGEPESIFLSERCENGPLEMAQYPDGFLVSFENDTFVGYSLSLNETTLFATPDGITVGTPRDVVDDRLTIMRTGTSAMGADYSTLVGYTISMADMGEGAKVSLIDAGTVCYR